MKQTMLPIVKPVDGTERKMTRADPAPPHEGKEGKRDPQLGSALA